jgi:predicted Rossmann fold flavoprotein
VTAPADILIVGAGAAGLWAAAVAARRGKRVVVLEKTGRAGSKILASGGTRCNLTTTLGPDAAARLFGDGERFILPSLRGLTPAAVRDHFHALDVPTVEEPDLEKVFPASQRAIDVRDALVRDAVAAGAELRFSAGVRSLTGTDGAWTLHTDSGDHTAPRVILSAGGRSYPATGTTGDAYAWLGALGLTMEHPVPALVPLTSGADWVTELSGISLQATEARLLDPAGRIVARRARPVIFTHHGLSGPGAMDLSLHVARASRWSTPEGWSVALDLLPHRDLDELRQLLSDAAGLPGAPTLARVLGESLPSRLLGAVCRQAGLDGDNPRLHQVDKKRRNRLVDALKGLLVPVNGTLGWDKAEVTGGGLALSEVDRGSMQVKRYPGLYVVGELLDLQGPIGGLNFQAAFATAQMAALHASR